MQMSYRCTVYSNCMNITVFFSACYAEFSKNSSDFIVFFFLLEDRKSSIHWRMHDLQSLNIFMWQEVALSEENCEFPLEHFFIIQQSSGRSSKVSINQRILSKRSQQGHQNTI